VGEVDMAQAGAIAWVVPARTLWLRDPWRGSLLPLGGAAVAGPVHMVFLKDCAIRFWGGFAAQREQAPSPPGGVDDSRFEPAHGG